MLSLNTINVNSSQRRVSFGTDPITAKNRSNDPEYIASVRKVLEPDLVTDDISLLEYSVKKIQKAAKGIIDAVAMARESKKAQEAQQVEFVSARKLSVLA